MWVMTSFGIFMPSLRPEEHVPAGDERKLQIRARRERELLILKELYMKDAGEIVHLPNTDYEFRIYCTHQEWANVMAQLALDIDYVKFKDTTDRWNDARLHAAYLRIWGILYDMFSTNRVFSRPVSSRSHGKKGKKGRKHRWDDDRGDYGVTVQRKPWWEDGSFEIDLFD